MKNSIKRIIAVLAVIAAGCGIFIFAKDTVIPQEKAAKTLSGNSKPDTVVVNMSVDGMLIAEDGKVTIPLFEGQKFDVTTTIERELLAERIQHLEGKRTDTSFNLTSKKPKIYELVQVSGLETVAQYNNRLECEANDKAGLGYINNSEAETQKAANKAAGKGEITNVQVESECTANEKSGLGKITNVEAETQKAANKAAGKGEITDAQAESECDANEKSGLGKITNAEAETQKAANKAAGKGEITDAQAESECDANEKSGLGKITNAEVETQKAANKAAGKGEITDAQVAAECDANEKSGLGKITNAQAETQKAANSKAGNGELTDAQVAAECAANEKAGLGKISNAKAAAQKAANKAAGKGDITDVQKTKQIAANKAAGKGAVTDYEISHKAFAEAKAYEAQGKIAFALGKYYDYLSSDLPVEDKVEAYEAYDKLTQNLVNGKPGNGEYNAFEIHDQWKKVLIDAEKYASSIACYDAVLGNLVQGDLDYKTKTASYSCEVNFIVSNRYKRTVGAIFDGYKKAFREDWEDLKDWPTFSQSYAKNAVYNANGALVYRYKEFNDNDYYYNAYASGVYNYNFSIVDESGKQLVAPVTVQPHKYFSDNAYYYNNYVIDGDTKVTFSNIPSSVMSKIDSGKAFPKLASVSLCYGCITRYNVKEYNALYGRKIDVPRITRAIQTAPLPVNSCFAKCRQSDVDREALTFDYTSTAVSVQTVDNNMVSVPGKNYAIYKTEVTRKLFSGVMGYVPGNDSLGLNYPVTNVTWNDAIYFCNKLSALKGLTPVYSVKGETDVSKWDYKPGFEHRISQGTVKIDSSADGYRLPTIEEWFYAAKGGENYRYSGSNEYYEVAHRDDYGNIAVPETKKPNGYGLYDMSGNVWEIVADFHDSVRYSVGGDISSYEDTLRVDRQSDSVSMIYEDGSSWDMGFRIVRNIK